MTPLQLFGYTIALGGLLYYKLGMDTLREYTSKASRSWGEFGATNPIKRRFLIIGASVAVVFLLLTQVMSYGPNEALLKGYLPGGTSPVTTTPPVTNT